MDAASRSGAPVVGAIIALAHDLDLMVVAEGVETEGQWNALTALGCDVIHGFLLYRPQSADAAGKRLAETASSPAHWESVAHSGVS